MTPEEIKAIEIRIEISKQLFGAAITIIGFQSALFLFVLEKKEGAWYFYTAALLALICFLFSLFFSGRGIDDQTANLTRKEDKKFRSQAFDYQVLFAIFGILFFILNVVSSACLDSRLEKCEQRFCCCEIQKCLIIDNKKGGYYSLIGTVGPFITGSNSLERSNNKLFNKLANLIYTKKYSTLFIIGGVDKRQLKNDAAKKYGDNLSLAQSRANIVKDSIEYYISLIKGQKKERLVFFTLPKGANYYTNSASKYQEDRCVEIYGIQSEEE